MSPAGSAGTTLAFSLARCDPAPPDLQGSVPSTACAPVAREGTPA